MVETRGEQAEATLNYILADLARCGQVQLLANAYVFSSEPEILQRIEDALNAAMDNCAVRPPSDFSQSYPGRVYLTDLAARAGLPESAYIKLAGILGKSLCVEDVFRIWENPSSSKTVKEACDDALAAAVASLESKQCFNVIAALRGGHTLPEKAGKACDEALTRRIDVLCAQSEPDQIAALVQQVGSQAVKDAAAAALERLGHITHERFSESLDVMKDCGEVEHLADIISRNPQMPGDTKKRIEAAIMAAMDIALTDGWEMGGVDAACNADYIWRGQKPFTDLLESGCSEQVKEKARGTLDAHGDYTYHPPQLPPALSAKREAQKPKVEAARRAVMLYVMQRHDSLGPGTLSEGTIEPPTVRAARSPSGRPLGRR